jgi:hypothetical protein
VLSEAVDIREEKTVFALVIKEKVGVLDKLQQVDGQEHVVPFGDSHNGVEEAIEIQAVWSDWMDKEIDSVQKISNGDGVNIYLRPSLVDSIALVYTRS